MPDILIVLIAGIFLPLFPMSMIFNVLFDRVCNPWLRSLLFIIWPSAGVLIVHKSAVQLPDWVFYLALTTSVLYAFRLLSLREVGQWSAFLATSLWSLIWIGIMQDTRVNLLYAYAVSMGLPLILLIHLSAGLEKRYGAAYTDLYGGLARSIPRFSGVLVTVVIAATATPLFPGFFIMLKMIVATLSISPVTAGVLLLIWLLWSWAAARLIQGLIVGPKSQVDIVDLNPKAILFYVVILFCLAVYGVYLNGVIL